VRDATVRFRTDGPSASQNASPARDESEDPTSVIRFGGYFNADGVHPCMYRADFQLHGDRGALHGSSLHVQGGRTRVLSEKNLRQLSTRLLTTDLLMA
jgi:hypothetical protein